MRAGRLTRRVIPAHLPLALGVKQRQHQIMTRVMPSDIKVQFRSNQLFRVDLAVSAAPLESLVEPTSAYRMPSLSHNGPASTAPRGPTIQLPPRDQVSTFTSPGEVAALGSPSSATRAG